MGLKDPQLPIEDVGIAMRSLAANANGQNQESEVVAAYAALNPDGSMRRVYFDRGAADYNSYRHDGAPKVIVIRLPRSAPAPPESGPTEENR